MEATLQLLRRPELQQPGAAGVRILLTAPQNYSADLLCSALAEAGVGPEEMVRVNDPRRPPPTVKEDVLPFCAMRDALRAFALPPALNLGRRRVVVCSCIAAGAKALSVYLYLPATMIHLKWLFDVQLWTAMSRLLLD